MTFALIFLPILLSGLVMLIKLLEKGVLQWITLYFVWAIMGFMFNHFFDYIEFYRTWYGMIILIISTIVAIPTYIWNLKREKTTLISVILERIGIALCYPLLMIETWIESCKMLYRLVQKIF